MSYKLCIGVFIFTLAILPQLIFAWGPQTHTYITEELFEHPEDNQIIRDCVPYKDAFLAGAEMPDITVIYYFEEGGKEYRATHNWNIQNELMAEARTDDEKCFAYGYASHLIADSVAHTKAIPLKIEANMLPNWIVHPLVEKKMDSVLVAENPGLMEKTTHMMDAIIPGIGLKAERYIGMMENALGTDSIIDVRVHTIKLAYALGTFYDTEFRPDTEGGIFAFYPLLDSATNVIHPIVFVVGYADLRKYADSSIDKINNIFNNWGARHALSPHGFDELGQADAKVGSLFDLSLLLALVMAFTLPLALTYLLKNVYYLALMPVLLLGILFRVILVYVMV